MTDDAPLPEELEAPFSVEGPGMVRRRAGTGHKLTDARRMMAGLKSVKRVLKLPLDRKRRRRLLPGRQRHHEEQAVEPPGDLHEQAGEPQEQQAHEDLLPEPIGERPEPGILELFDGEHAPWDDAPAAPRDPDYSALDDVPSQIKKRLREEDQEPEAKRIRTNDFANFVLVALSEKELDGNQPVKANEWLPRAEVDRLGQLLDLPLSSARLHRAPRKRLQHPGPQAKKARITVMFGEDPKQAMIAQETAEEVRKRPARRCPHLWRGVSLFLSSKKGRDAKRTGLNFT